MTWSAIASLLSGLLGKALAFLAPFWLGKKVAENKELKRDVEEQAATINQAKEARAVEDTIRILPAAAVDERLRKFSKRKP
jgi:hypothetical protein